MSETVSENEINRMFWGVKEERKRSAFKLNLPSFIPIKIAGCCCETHPWDVSMKMQREKVAPKPCPLPSNPSSQCSQALSGHVSSAR